ncbi:type VII secretion protein EccC [Micromonospora polyrhachis]|uniref:S-DNA-T family DNA segregation ATPase FtsK/SpoIIIE n=1 Tax=Micromonospora polyrhachis TaxID=1282883 RepID=A0A7W7SMI0_9ACTN|nr:type VII secretion protein EccCa [Micromonospora polyrhachis]MBB4956952.1 S-DNA-T family DNA segregation ATPase FtsK/SpoIIIE [Micromonospora polyrhachis]
MSTIPVTRSPRRSAPAIDKGEFALQEPPGLPEPGGSQLTNLLTYLPMMMGTGALALFYLQSGESRVMLYLTSGLMGLSAIIMAFALLMRAGSERKAKLKGERRDYLRYLGQARKQVRRSVDRQRRSVLFTHPDPARLWALVPTDRLWERRTNHADFAEVRIGLGQQRLALTLQAPQTKPVEDLEPLCASALRRFLRAYTVIEDMPVAVYLRGFARVSLDGDDMVNRALVRAMVAQLVTFHTPEELHIAVLASTDRLRYWDWVKWLPHAQHAEQTDAAGAVRLVCDSWVDLEKLLGGKALDDRGRYEPGATPTPDEPFVVVILDDPPISGNHRLGGAGYRNLVAIDTDATLPWDGAATTLRLRIGEGHIDKVDMTRSGDEKITPIGRADAMSLVRVRALARQVAPYRVGGSGAVTDAAAVTADLPALLGIADLRAMDPQVLWQARTAWDHLRVPIGITDRGQTVELDLKESAQGGMGPHGILIGATGSGKSELIRTLVLSLALAHSSEKLNMVLVDFKGGATFLGLDGLPHVSALITNLVDELPLVDRMQDALQGELVRRQELLRKHSHTSVLEYERARAAGAELDPLPTLVVIVDEFGELLSVKSEFTDLFMMIGRLGRSLGVHLLLASQRFEEGRVHTLETHLSYRMGLKMFSAMESRSVIGVSDAYDKPLMPGSGYLRTDTTTLVKFRGAYVSGPCPVRGKRVAQPVSNSQVVNFESGFVVPTRPIEPPPRDPAMTEETPSTETTLAVIVDRLRDAGPPAHRVWLPPLAEPARLDEMLPPLALDPQRGYGAPYGGLRVPVGLVDRPFEQRRDPLLADLEGAKGHAAVVGAPRSGKSTLLRTLVAGLALSHTPREVQCYILDFGGGAMAALAGLPHVGGVANRRDRERVTRTVAEVYDILDQREEFFGRHDVESMAAYRRARAAGQYADDPFGDVFLVIDGWFTLHQEFEGLEPTIQEIATRGLSYGVHLVISAGRWSEIRPWLRDVLQTRFELRLGDSMESEIDFRKAKTVPEAPGRGLTVDKFHFLSAVPAIGAMSAGDDDGAEAEPAGEAAAALAALVEAVRSGWSEPPAPAVRLLPKVLDRQALPSTPADGELRVALGLDDQRLQPVWHDFGTNPHLMVFGDTETGKTNLLRHLAQAIVERFPAQEAQVLVADPRRNLATAFAANQTVGYALNGKALREVLARGVPLLKSRVPGPDIAPDRLSTRDWWSGPRLFVLMDDYDMVSGMMDYPAETLVDLLAHGAEIGLHVIVARSTAGAARGMTDPLLRRLWDLGSSAVLFSCPRDESGFLGQVKPLTLPAGRAQLVRRRADPIQFQTPLVADPTGDDPREATR